MENLESNHPIHEDFPLIAQLAKEEGVETWGLIESSGLLKSLDQLHETRQLLRGNALRMTPCDELEKEMIDMEQRVAA